MQITWERREAGGYTTELIGLGRVEIYNSAEDGRVVYINGKCAWSHWREDVESMKITLATRFRNWEYLNSFKAI